MPLSVSLIPPQNNTAISREAPYGAGAFQKISDDDQKILVKKFYSMWVAL